MTDNETYRWRKTTDINREHSLFELLESEALLLDVGFSDDGVFQVAFNSSIGGRIMEFDKLINLLNNGRKIAESDL